MDHSQSLILSYSLLTHAGVEKTQVLSRARAGVAIFGSAGCQSAFILAIALRLEYPFGRWIGIALVVAYADRETDIGVNPSEEARENSNRCP